MGNHSCGVSIAESPVVGKKKKVASHIKTGTDKLRLQDQRDESTEGQNEWISVSLRNFYPPLQDHSTGTAQSHSHFRRKKWVSSIWHKPKGHAKPSL